MGAAKTGPTAPKKTPELIDAILLEFRSNPKIAEREACEKHDIAQSTWTRWKNEDENLQVQYARARTEQRKLLRDEIIRIAYDPNLTSDQKRVMIDAIKWILAKEEFKKYGDKLDVTGSLEVAPLVMVNSRKRLVSDQGEDS